MVVHDGPSTFVRIALRIFGTWAGKRMHQYPQLGMQLARAGDPLVPVAYLAGVYLRIALSIAAGIVLFLLYLVFAGTVRPGMVFAMALAPVALSTITYTYYLIRPEMQRVARRRNLDSNLPYALNFLAALASAGVVPDELFGALGRQKVYGEVATQAVLIHRDTKLFGKDLVTAMRDGARRSPSQSFEDFLQGGVSTVTSGGDLKLYFLTKAEHYAHENHRRQKAFLESMGVMAESYVVVAAAAPLFLIVILSVLVLLQEGLDPVFFLNIIILVAMPLIHGSFTAILRSLRPD